MAVATSTGRHVDAAERGAPDDEVGHRLADAVVGRPRGTVHPALLDVGAHPGQQVDDARGGSD